MGISPRRMKRTAVAAGRRGRRTDARRRRRARRSAGKPKLMENNFTEKDLGDIADAKRVFEHFAKLPPAVQPASLAGLFASILKFKIFLQENCPRSEKVVSRHF